MSYFYKPLIRLFVVLFLLFGPQQIFAAVFTVTNNNSSGAGSLAQAITDANTNPGPDIINFNLPVGQETINLTAGLPVITDEVFINGYSQPLSSAGDPGGRVIVVNINGAALGGGSNIFVIAADNVSIAGLAIYGAPNYNIWVNMAIDNVFIWGNYIGTNNTGNTPGLGGGGGIAINQGGASVSTGNVIGTNGDGTDDGNEGNVIVAATGTGTNGFGIVLWRTENSTVAANYIGIDKDLSFVAGLGNAQDGVLVTVEADNNFIGTDGDGTSDAQEANYIAANGRYGVLIAANAENNVIAGNTIGLPAGNAAAGILVLNSSLNRIGTNADGTGDDDEGNVICLNGTSGIEIMTDDFFGFHGQSNNNIVAGNFIGVDRSLSSDLGNTGAGILLLAGVGITPPEALNVNNNIIGANGDGVADDIERNIILYNANGIVITNPVAPSTATGNRISRNAIFLNDQLAIDLGANSVTSNDDGDADAGPNNLFNAPVISSTQVSGTNLVITGFSRPGSIIEFYVADAAPNPNPLPGGFTKSFGEGESYLFRAQDDAALDGINDDAAGTSTYDGTLEGTGTGGTRTENQFSFTIPIASLPVPVTNGTRISAIAYDAVSGAANTSEFGGVTSTSTLPVNLTSFKGRVNGDKAELTWTTSSEFNNSHFDIEKSANGQSYSKAGTVRGNGGTNNAYQFTDKGPLSSINYYRLKQVDGDGRSTYSRVLVLRKEIGSVAAKALPNPFTSHINLSYKLEKEENIRIRLYDQGGRIVKTFTTRGGVGVNTFNLNNLDNLAKGNYTLELTGETISFRQQVLKQ